MTMKIATRNPLSKTRLNRHQQSPSVMKQTPSSQPKPQKNSEENSLGTVAESTHIEKKSQPQSNTRWSLRGKGKSSKLSSKKTENQSYSPSSICKHSPPPWGWWKVRFPGKMRTMAARRKYPQVLRERALRFGEEAREASEAEQNPERFNPLPRAP